jgi:rRNA maturation endonuclease Nob1
MAKNKSLGRQESITLSELINATIIKTINIKNMTSSADDKEIEPVSNKCAFCGEIIDVSWAFCKKCGKEL